MVDTRVLTLSIEPALIWLLLPQLAVPSLPAAAGDRYFYTYFPGVQRWYCKLCWKWVDDEHVQSKKHSELALIPDVFGVYPHRLPTSHRLRRLPFDDEPFSCA